MAHPAPSSPTASSRAPAAARLHRVRYGPPAHERLGAVVAARRGGDPLAPVTVVVPGVAAGLAARRALARSAPAGLVNVRFVSLNHVAELIGAPFLAEPGRRPLTRTIQEAAIRRALAEQPGPFARVAAHPATIERLAATAGELAGLDTAALDRLAGTGARAEAVVAIHRRAREIAGHTYDDEEQLRAAAAMVEAGSAVLADLGAVVWWLPREATPGARAFAAALAARGRLDVIVGFTGDPTADRGARELVTALATHLGGADGEEPRGAPVVARIVSAPTPDEEAREAVRTVAAALESGTRLDRVALVYRAAEPYGRLLVERCQAAGLPVNGPGHRRLADTVAGRTLLALLALPERQYRRDAVMAVLAGAPVRSTAGGVRVPASRWDRISRGAHVVQGADQWRTRLERHAARAGELLERPGEPADPERVARLVADTEALATYVAELVERTAPPASPSWVAWAEWAAGLLERYLGPPSPSWPVVEADAYESVIARVRALGALEELAPPLDADAFRAVVARELELRAGHVGRFGEGVHVGPLAALAGTDFDLAVVVGGAEGRFPPPARDDPLLPERERRATGGALPTRADRRDRDRHDVLAALASAGRVVLSFPRADPSEQRAHVPAPLVLEAATRLAGTLVGADDLAPGHAVARQGEADGWLRVVASAREGIVRAPTTGSRQEWAMTVLERWRDAGHPVAAHPLARADAALARGFAAVASRTAATLTDFDGIVGPHAGLAPGPDRPVSPTALERWARCPFSYLLRQVLHVRAPDRPEREDRLDLMARGSMVHRVLERFFAEGARPDADGTWSTGARAELHRLLDEEASVLEAEGRTGRPLLWRIDRARLARELDRVLDADVAVRERFGVVPHGFEVPFGKEGDPLGPVQVVADDGTVVRFRGTIDRVDVGPDGRALVLDYKTGRRDDDYKKLRDDPVNGGRLLQLAVYGLAVQQHLPAEHVDAAYWFTREGVHDPLQKIAVDEHTRTRFTQVVGTMLGEIRAGVFPAYPGEEKFFGPENCGHCDYASLCPPDRVRRWERKQGDRAAAAFLALRAGPGSPDEPTAEPAEPTGGGPS